MEHFPLPNHESEYSVAKFAPLCIELAKKIYGKANPTERQVIQLAHLTTRRPDKNNPNTQIELALVESFKTQFSFLEDKDNFGALLESDGLFGSVDGFKIQTINTRCGSSAADSVIVGNLETLLQTAKDLDLNMLVGIYSGDENGLAIAPKKKDLRTREQLKELFENKLNKNIASYYSHPYFAPMQAALKQEHKRENLSLGLTINLFNADSKLMYLPTKYVVGDDGKLTISSEAYVPPIKTIVGSMLDNKVAVTHGTPLIDPFIKALTTSNFAKEMEHAAYEQLFPDHLKIRKIGTLPTEIKRFQDTHRGENLHLIQIADILLKDTNSQSHALGDFHMIATMNIFQRYLKEELGLNPHDDITYYQHNGSFLLTMTEEKYDIVKQILDDPIAFNNHIQAEEMLRYEQTADQATLQDPAMRAKPYIVGTSSILNRDGSFDPITIPSNMETKEIFELIDLVKLEQITNETLVCLYASGLAHELPTSILNQIEKILAQRGMKPNNHDVAKLIDLTFMASIFKRYNAKRPNNFINTMQLLKSLIPRNFAKSFSRLTNRLK